VKRDDSRGTCTPVLIAALFTIAELWKQPRCPTADEWIKKTWYLYTMESYAAVKKNEMLSFAGNWMELENIILSEVSLANDEIQERTDKCTNWKVATDERSAESSEDD
jgi:hypothetical protein